MMNRILRASAVVFALLLSATSASAATLTLQWDRNAEPTVTGYVVSYGTKTGTYTNTVDVGNQVTATLTLTPTTTTTYFFAVRAYTPTTTSAYSTEVSTTITIVPSQATLNIDGPVLDSIQNGDMLISGWAVDKASTAGTGIDAIHVYAYPNPGSGAAPVFLGKAS
jgi:hypothetical protein